MFGGENQTRGFVTIFGHAKMVEKRLLHGLKIGSLFFQRSWFHRFMGTGPEEWHSNLQLGAGQVPWRFGPGEI